ncbi:MAG TPA: hypothetical protein VHF06_20340 [Pseudonocardiaceae bacterium]|jgi:hypothetical protein|nr:hypothetical protein [Pseudonocardiaceae bacterium]
MGTSNYDMTEIGQARQTIGAEAGKFGAVGDGIPASVDGGMFGTLPNSAALSQAASSLCSSLRSEYAKAESLVGAIERTLDTNVTNKSNTEQGNKQSLTVQQV